MGNNKKINSLGITLDDKPAYLNLLRKKAEEEGMNYEGDKSLHLSHTDHNAVIDEFYFNEDDGSIVLSANLGTPKGECLIYIDVPLTNEIIIDILKHQMQKYDKLKNVLESLK